MRTKHQAVASRMARSRLFAGLGGAFSTPAQGGFWSNVSAGLGGSLAGQGQYDTMQAQQERQALADYLQQQGAQRQQAQLDEQIRHNKATENKPQPDPIAQALELATMKSQHPDLFPPPTPARDPFETFVKEAQYRAAHPDQFKTGGESTAPSDNAWLDNLIVTTRSGKKFLNASELQGKQKEAAILKGAAEGLPVLGSADVSELHDINAATANADGVLDQIHNILPKNAQARIAAFPGIRLGQLLQTNSTMGAFNTWRGSAIRTLRATAGSKGLRLNQKEIDLAIKNEIPQLTDTYATATQKVANIKQMLHNAENPILSRNWSEPSGGSAAPSGQQFDYNPKTGELIPR